MSMRMASFLAGFGGGYLKADRQKRDDERQAKLDARSQEEFDRKKSEWKDADQLKTDLKDAGAVRTEQQGTATQGQVGGVMQNTFNQNPEEAQRVKAMMDAEAEMTGAAPAAQQQTTAVTGNMARGHQIGQTMGAMGANPNSTEAVAQRTAQAYRQNGQMDKAIQMENAIMDQQAKRLGLSMDQLKFADMQTNRALESALKSGSTWYEGAAKLATDTKRGGLDGVSVEPVVSADGKTVTMRAKMPDGTTKDAGTYATDEAGMLQFSRQFATLPIEKRMDMMADKLRQEKDDARRDRTEAKENDRWERTFEFNKKKDENDQQYKNRVLGFQARQEARAAQTHKLAMEDAKIPPAVKTLASSYQKQIESASAALNKAMAEGSFNPESPGTKQLIQDQKDAMQSLVDTLAPYTKKAEGGAPTADPLEHREPGAPASSKAAAPAQTSAPAAQKPVVSMSQAIPAAPKAPPTVLEALNPGGNASLNGTLQPKAQAIESLAAQLKQAQATMAQAAQGNPQAAIAQAQSVQAIRNAINKQLEGMNPQQAAQVTQAAGL